MRIVGPLILTLALAAVAWVGTQYAGLYAVFGIVIQMCIRDRRGTCVQLEDEFATGRR